MSRAGIKVGVVGATGMVGQRFLTLLEDHPYFEVTALCASARSAGKTYGEAVAGRWKLDVPMPERYRDMEVLDAERDIRRVRDRCSLVFCAVSMGKSEVLALEEAYARAEIPVVSNNSANRQTPDVPMVIPEINPSHLAVIPAQRRRLGTARGFIAVKPNCSIQSYVPALTPLLPFRPTQVAVTTFQAVSGAGRTLRDWPEMRDNVIPYIGGEEEKSESEPLRIWGREENGAITPADPAKGEAPVLTAQCLRVPVSDGHTAAVFVRFADRPERAEILRAWETFEGPPQRLRLPHAPARFLTYFEDSDRPQPALDRGLYGGMGIGVGRLREDPLFDYKFVCLSHNTLRGAAGGGVLIAELLYRQGYLD